MYELGHCRIGPGVGHDVHHGGCPEVVEVEGAELFGPPRGSANMDGTSMEVLVVKRFARQSLWNWAKTFALMSRSTGTDSLMMSASRRRFAGYPWR
jgi:hypothetical protein